MASPVFKAASNFEFFVSVMMRFIVIGIIIYLGFHYEENPAVISVAIFAVFLFLLFAGNDEIIVYPDKVVAGDTSIVSLFKKRKEYDLADIKSASLQEKKKFSKPGEAGLALLLVFIFPVKRIYRRRVQTIQLHTGNEEVIRIVTDIPEEDAEQVIDAINDIVFRGKKT